jgi:hypothetical protein
MKSVNINIVTLLRVTHAGIEQSLLETCMNDNLNWDFSDQRSVALHLRRFFTSRLKKSTSTSKYVSPPSTVLATRKH